jgi:hypothetical protein
MKAFLETTEWADTPFNCNHVYWMNDSKDKMYAYARFGNPKDTQVFKNPIRIDNRGRKFVEVRRDIYGWTDPDDVVEVTANPTWRVAGSKGAEYVVEKDGSVYTCTCPGYKYRGECRHAKEVEANA